MNAMTTLTFGMAFALVLAFLWFIRAAYRLVIFRLMTEHRETILKGADLLDEKHHLSDEETRAVAVAVLHLYDYRVKSELARGTLEFVKRNAKTPQPSPMRDDVHQISKAFAALVLAENPFYTLCILNTMVSRRAAAARTGTAKQYVLDRAEITVASQLPRIDREACHPVAA